MMRPTGGAWSCTRPASSSRDRRHAPGRGDCATRARRRVCRCRSARVLGTRGRLRIMRSALGAPGRRASRRGADPRLRPAADVGRLHAERAPALAIARQAALGSALQAFMPGRRRNARARAGACRGVFSLAAAIERWRRGRRSAARRRMLRRAQLLSPPTGRLAASARWRRWPATPAPCPADGAPAQQSVRRLAERRHHASDLALALREGFLSVEHIKRYTTTGMATDQGKTSNLNALGSSPQRSTRPSPRSGSPLSACPTRR